MDILTGIASFVRVDDEQDCKVQLLEHLGAKRRKHARKLHATVAKYGASARNHLKQTLRRVDPILSSNSKDGDSMEGSVQIAASALKMESQVAAPARLGRGNLHPYRLRVRELQNVLKLASNADNQEFIDALGKVKDANRRLARLGRTAGDRQRRVGSRRTMQAPARTETHQRSKI